MNVRSNPDDVSSGPSADPPAHRAELAFAALRHRDFQLFYGGQLVSLVGTAMQTTALSWLVYRLTRSGTALGNVAFAANAPVLFLGYFVGSVVDRADRRRLVIGAQAVDMVLAFLTAWLTWSGRIRVPHVMAIAVVGGIAHAIEIPARQTLLMDLVGRADLLSAITLNSAAFNVARILGPPIAGFSLPWLTEAGCFTINGLSFVAVILGLSMIRGRQATPPASASAPADPFAGLRYIGSHPEMVALMLMVVIANLFGIPNTYQLVPVYVDRVLHGDAATLGLYNAAFGVGALVGGYRVASRRKGELPPRVAGFGFLSYAVAVYLLALAPGFLPGMALMAVVGFSMLTQLATTNNYLQTRAPEALRGRVVAAYTTTLVGLLPIGCVMMGRLVDAFGVQPTMRLGAVLCAVSALVCLRWLPGSPPAPDAART